MDKLFILASRSPRRKQLFLEIVKDFICLPSDADESLPKGISPEEAVKLLSLKKAEASLKEAQNAGMGGGKTLIVLGSDTVVAYNGEILGKPEDEADAVRILKMLSGKEHSVFTGVTFLTSTGVALTDAVESKVLFKTLSKEEISAYVESGSPMDKAGAYGIQDGVVVESYTGSYSNIVGLPVERCKELYEEIIKLC